jgi:hypothetical protein
MIRPVLTEIGIFLIPFVVYALFLVATRAGVFTPESWSFKIVGALTAIALVLLLASLVLLAQRSGAPPGSTYVPAHIENGKLVPGKETWDRAK